MQSLASFEVLARKVKETFALGNRRIRKEMVRTYWTAGRYIHKHILHHQDRADYGEETLLKLSRRLDVSKQTITRSLKIYREFPKIVPALEQLELTHLYALASIPDKGIRSEFAKRAVAGGWNTRQLEYKIKKELRDDSVKSDKKSRSQNAAPAPKLLKPKLGILYTYKMIESKPLQDNPGRLKVDLGFNVHRVDFKRRGDLRAEDVVESHKSKNGVYTVARSRRTAENLYTYQAWVERLPDGDTQFVEIDLGFDDVIEQYLRLRGINTPEIKTAKGKKAKAFVEQCLRTAPYILLTSSRSDKFDRYLSDIFVPLRGGTVRPSAPEARIQYEGEEFLYLNNELLLRKLAVRY